MDSNSDNSQLRKMNKTMKTIIFDFDGTIANTLDAVVNIYNDIAPKYNCKPVKHKDRKKLQAKRPQEFLKNYGVNHLKLFFLVIHTRRKLRNEIGNIKPIIGITQALKELKIAGFNLGIMTSNSKINVNIFLEMNGIKNIFDFIYTSKNIFGKDKTINQLLKNHKIRKDSVVYVGDETRDIEAARKVGIPIVAVSWGFNAREILALSEPDKIIDNPKKMLECLQKITEENKLFYGFENKVSNTSKFLTP